jgi:uncharacterized protein (DUF342 family)
MFKLHIFRISENLRGTYGSTAIMPMYLLDTNHLLIRGVDMGRINNIIQRHVDEHIEQKLALLTEQVEKLEKTVLELKSELSEIHKEPPKKKGKGKAGLLSD